MVNCWILVAPKNHVRQSVIGNFAQAEHGKSHPLRRMKVGDGVIYYSPKLEFGGEVVCQSFTAIGCVVGEEIYRSDLGNEYNPHRRNVRYLPSKDAPIAPLINRLTFIKDKTRWGLIFKYGIIHIPTDDFEIIATAMNVNLK